MSRSTLIVAAAFFVMLVPFLGFPRSWEPNIFLALGGLIVIVELYAVLGRAQEAFFRDYEVRTEVYAERIQGRVRRKRSEDRESGLATEGSEEDLKEGEDKDKDTQSHLYE